MELPEQPSFPLPKYLLQGVALCLCWLAGAATLYAQTSAPGWTPAPFARADGQAPPLSLAEQARRGAAPPSRAHSQIKLEATSLRRLAPLAARELKPTRADAPLRIGVLRPLPEALDMRAEMTSFDVAEGRLQIARIVSAEAVSLRLHFTGVALPPGARLFIYAPQRPEQFYGPYEAAGPNGDGEFWTPPLVGDGAVIEYFVPLSQRINNDAALPFRVAQLSHAFQDERMALPGLAAQSGPGACNVNVPPAWSEAAKSIARLRFVRPEGEFLCTGTLLNTSDNSGKPYLLTANHCFSTPAAAASLVATWLYDAGDDPTRVLGLPSNHGAYLLATGARSDFTFVELRTPVPNGVRFSGWTTEPPAPETPVASIHHPFGSYRRIAFGKTVSGACPPGLSEINCDNFLKARWDEGVTEPGSSGGALWSGEAADPRFVGALLGGESACDNRGGLDVFGRFELTFAAIAFYLTGQGCVYEPSAWERVAEASGGAGSIGVILREGEGCAWTASADAPWIRITGNANGVGNGTVNYELEPNPANKPRLGSVIIAGQVLTILQLGTNSVCQTTPLAPGQPVQGELSRSDCRSLIDDRGYADRYTFDGRGGQEVTISLRAPQLDGFLTLLNAAGEVIAQNDDAPSFGGARIPASAAFTLPADGVYTIEVTTVAAEAVGSYTLELLTTGCVYTATLETPTFGHLGGDGRVVVRTEGGGGCQWPKDSNRPWLTPPSVSFAGTTPPVYNGSFRVGTHHGGAPRIGTLTIAGASFNITQHAQCSAARPATLSATTLNLSSYGGQQTLSVEVPPERTCSWSVHGSEYWLIIQSGFDGIGSGAVRLRFLPNPFLIPRTATLTIAGQTVNVTQEPAGGICQAAPIEVGQIVHGSLSNNDCGAPAAQGSLADHYSFTAVARQQVAIIVTGQGFVPSVTLYGPRGDNNGVVAGPAGTTGNEVRLPAQGYAELSLAGQYTIVVSAREPGQMGSYAVQLIGLGGAGCSYQITSGNYYRLASAGGTSNITLAAPDGCSWTASSNVPWLTFANATGSGGGPINFTVAPNTGAPRRGGAFIANRYFEVLQDAPCSYLEIYPEQLRADARGGRLHVSLKIGRNCPWDAASKSDWLTLTSVFRSDESGTVLFDYTENPGPLRTGNVEIAGQTFEVRQGGSNLVTVSAASFAPGLARGSIASIFGAELATRAEVATTVPLPETLGGAEVRFYHPNGGLLGRAQLFFAEPEQINFYIPENLSLTEGRLEVAHFNGLRSLGPLRLTQVAPGLFSANANGQGVAAAVVLRIKADGAQSYEPVARFDATAGRFVPVPIELESESEQVFLLLFGTGIRHRSSLAAVTATIGGAPAEALYAGAQSGFVGLDQVNLRLPRELAERGEVAVVLTVEGKNANVVTINIK